MARKQQGPQSGSEPGQPIEPGPPAEPGDPTQPSPTEPVPVEPTQPIPPVEPTQPIPPVEPTQPVPPLQPIPAPPSGPQPVNPMMGSYSSGPPPQPGPYPGYGGQQYPGQPFPGQAAAYTGPQYPDQVPTEQLPGQPAGAYPGQPAAYPGPPGGAYPGQTPGPYPGQQYPTQPYAGQPYPGAPFTPPPAGPQQKGNKGPLILAGGIGLLVLILVVVLAFSQNRNAVVQPTAGATTAGGTATSVQPPQPADASAAVQGYLDALAQGDADTALAYAAVAPDDTSLLTRDVLAASLLRAPISDIRVAKGTGSGTTDTIDASYKVGNRVVDASFPVVKAGADWRLAEVASAVDLSSVSPNLLALTLNGVPLAGTSLFLFPGSYLVAANDSRYTVSKGSFLVESPADPPQTSSMRLKLSAAGIAKVRSAAQKKFTSCLRARSLAPKGCGFGSYLPGNNKPRNSSIRWTVVKNGGAMRKLTPTADAANPAVVRDSVNVQVRVNLSSTNGRRWVGYSAIYQVLGDLSASGVKITFS